MFVFIVAEFNKINNEEREKKRKRYFSHKGENQTKKSVHYLLRNHYLLIQTSKPSNGVSNS